MPGLTHVEGWCGRRLGKGKDPREERMRAIGSFATTQWGVRRLTVLGLVGTLLAVMLASSAAATGAPRAGAADPPPYLADASDPAVTTLAADLGISIREAQRRLGWQEPAMQLAGELERALGDRYGDLWFDPADGGRVKVGIVGGGDAAALAARLVARRQLTAVTDLVPVRHSYAELRQAAAWLTAETARANPRPANGLVKGLTVWRLPDKNAVELDLPRGQRLTTAQQATVAAARQRLGDKLTFGTWAGQTRDLACAWGAGEFDCDPPLRGGVMMYTRNASGGYDARCTVGFNAKSTVDGKWYVLTAGHCGPPGRTFYVYQRRTGRFHVLGHMHRCIWGEPGSGCVYSGNDDEGIITIDNVPGWDPKPWVYVHAWTGPVAGTTTNPGYPIYGTGGSSLGMRVCVSGAISGTSCGNVEQLGGGGLARVDVCGEPGDSGAPIFSGQKAYGLLKGANPPENPGDPPTPRCQDRLYQGITEATQRLHVAVALALP
jgi:streptogrisin C